MDYKKLYEKAVERAKTLTNSGFNDFDFVKHIFPELAESEDEKIKKGIIRNLEYLMNRAEGFVKDELKEKIAWLEKQGEQNPAWSEEDSPYYDDICEMLINLLHSETADVNKGAVQKDLDWFISLRPQSTWKPSDAQMASITCAVRNIKESACYDSELVSLFNDLKKLKGLSYESKRTDGGRLCI